MIVNDEFRKFGLIYFYLFFIEISDLKFVVLNEIKYFENGVGYYL